MVEISTGGATWSLTGQYCPFILREQVSPGCPARWIINLAALVPTAEVAGFACGVVVNQGDTAKQEGGTTLSASPPAVGAQALVPSYI